MQGHAGILGVKKQAWSQGCGVTQGGTGTHKHPRSDAWPQQTPVLPELGCHGVAVAEPPREGCTSMWGCVRLWHRASPLGAGPWRLWGLILQSSPSPPRVEGDPSISLRHPHRPSPGVSPAASLSPAATERIMQTVEITKHVVDIEEKGVKLRLTIVDTPGFGDAVNNTEWCVPGRGGSGVSPGPRSAAVGASGSEGGMPTVPGGGMLSRGRC